MWFIFFQSVETDNWARIFEKKQQKYFVRGQLGKVKRNDFFLYSCGLDVFIFEKPPKDTFKLK